MVSKKCIEIDEKVLEQAKQLAAETKHTLKYILWLAVVDGIRTIDDMVEGGGEI